MVPCMPNEPWPGVVHGPLDTTTPTAGADIDGCTHATSRQLTPAGAGMTINEHVHHRTRHADHETTTHLG
jgi:hypothetical protein